MSRVLAGSWRPAPPPPDFTVDELLAVQEHVLASGAGALAWWRIRDTPVLAGTPVGARLRDAFRVHRLHAGVHERDIAAVIPALRGAGCEPILIKGWDAARAYPERGLRPYGDIDLLVRPAELPIARAALADLPQGGAVDLTHDVEVPNDERALDELFARSRLVPLGRTVSADLPVRVLAREDALRLSCLHLLKHGAWRPSWLCDVAVSIEALGGDFNWEGCLGDDANRRGQVLATVALAGSLLGAELGGTPEGTEGLPPTWLLRRTFRAWSSPWPIEHGPAPEALAPLSRPMKVLRGLRARWPDPIVASVSIDAPFDGRPRLPFQLAYTARRAGRYLRSQKDRA